MDNNRLSALKNLITEHTADIDAFAKLSNEVRDATDGISEVHRKAEFLMRLANELPTPVFEDEIIVGSMRFWHSNAHRFCNTGHIVVDYGFVLEYGLSALRKKILERDSEDAAASAEAVAALSTLILRYAGAADTVGLHAAAAACRNIAFMPPADFHEAVQLVWFVHLFLHAEGMSAAVSFGRLDQYLWRYYDADISKGSITRKNAKDILCALWLKSCEGDESQNLIVGGNCENELSILCLEVTRELQVKQPSLSVRIGNATTEHLWNETCAVIKTGLGMPAIFNDRVVESSLMALGIPKNEACDYAIVGCYESNPPNALGLTVAGTLVLHEILLSYMGSTAVCDKDFRTYLDAFKSYFKEYYMCNALPNYALIWEQISSTHASPFESACIRGCVESGLAAEHKGAKYTMFGINILGLGTLTDSLYAIKTLVFDEKVITYDEFVSQVLNNFPDNALFERCRNLPGKYGTDSPITNALARELSEYIARTVIDNRFDGNVITYPGFFIFTHDIYGSFPATPDGRRAGERVSYGVAASDICFGRTATSVLNSSANASNELCACGNPVMLHLTSEEASGEQGDVMLKSLIRGFFENGGFHVQFNVSDSSVLHAAKESPELYSDLMIRISGFSTQFVRLDEKMQDALIERAEL